MKTLNPVLTVLPSAERHERGLNILVAEVPVPIRRAKLKISDEVELSPAGTVANLVKLDTEWKTEPRNRIQHP